MSDLAAARAPQNILLRVAAINFDATVYDTDDLSTIRGASLILLDGVGAVEAMLRERFGARAAIETVESGASVLIVSIASPDGVPLAEIESAVRAHLAGEGRFPQLRHFCFAVSTDAGAGALAERIARLEAHGRTAQYRMLSAPLFDAPGKGGRPSDLSHCLPGVKADKDGALLSAADAARREFGRQARSGLYDAVLPRSPKGREIAKKLADAGLGYARSLGDLRARRVGEINLPLSLHGKIALLHLDGNAFGAIRRERMAQGAGAAAAFSAYIRGKQADLLCALLEWSLQQGDDVMILHRDGEKKLRLETLLWGGDEIVLALPAHAAWDIAGLVCRELETWRLPREADPKQRALTHGVGLLFANYKTPIRQLRLLVEDLTEAAKTVRDRVNLQAFALETVDLPDGGLDAARCELFQLKDCGVLHLRAGRERGFAEADQILRETKKRLPRSLAMKLALAATGRDPGLDEMDLKRAHAGEEWEKFARAQLDRVLSAHDRAFVEKALFGDLPGYSAQTRAASLLNLLNLWDYIAPLDEAGATEQAA